MRELVNPNLKRIRKYKTVLVGSLIIDFVGSIAGEDIIGDISHCVRSTTYHFML